MKLTLFITAILFARFSFAQEPAYFIEKLEDNSNQQVLTRVAVHDSIGKYDTATIIRVIGEMEKAVAHSSGRMKTRVAALKSRLFFYKLGPGDSIYAAQMKDALYKSNELDELFMIAEYSQWYSEMLNTLKRREQAVQYGLNALRLQEDLGTDYFPSFNSFYLSVGEMFYRTRNPEEAIATYKKALSLPGIEKINPVLYANALNTVGLSYKWIEKYDSCLVYFLQCMDYALKNNIPDWYYVASDNRFDGYVEIGQYDSVKAIAQNLYNEGMKANDLGMLMSSYFMQGRSALRQRQFTKAIPLLLKSEEYATKIGYRANSLKLYKDLYQCYDSIGQPALAYTYYRMFKQLQDSTDYRERVISTNYLYAKANFEKEQLDFKALKAKRAKDIMFRNVGIVSLIIISGVGLWFLNRRRKKAEGMHAQAEKQLQGFREEMIGKNQRIDTLLNDLQTQEHNSEKAGKMEELAKQIILTEDDWQRFQSMFNKVYPGFFHRLREKANGITEAELRLASLIRIQLNTRQIAAMQGISSDAVHKTRQRLRQRFSTASTSELEAIIVSI
jgi:tetratricopeptide (TPR) repeat protein